jgi:hypothetical protein
VYTWPRTSRVVVLTLTICVLGYEFIYKELCRQSDQPSNARALKALVYSCMVPYGVGTLALLALAWVAAGK